MNVIAKTQPETIAGVEITDHADGLATFLDPGSAAAVWRRSVPADVQSWLNRLDPACLPSGRVILPTAAVAETVRHLCDMSGLPQGPARDWLEADILSLANLFASLMDAKFLRLRLSVVTSNSCRKFHVDAIKGRLVCTYRGTGTQYGLADGDNDPARIFTVPTGAPILLRGTLWPARQPARLLHRSPPIEGTGENRLLLVLDPVVDPENEI